MAACHVTFSTGMTTLPLGEVQPCSNPRPGQAARGSLCVSHRHARAWTADLTLAPRLQTSRVLLCPVHPHAPWASQQPEPGCSFLSVLGCSGHPLPSLILPFYRLGFLVVRSMVRLERADTWVIRGPPDSPLSPSSTRLWFRQRSGSLGHFCNAKASRVQGSRKQSSGCGSWLESVLEASEFDRGPKSLSGQGRGNAGSQPHLLSTQQGGLRSRDCTRCRMPCLRTRWPDLHRPLGLGSEN